MKTTKLLPGSVEEVNGIIYFRLANGNVATKNTSNVIIESTSNDCVELITFETNSANLVPVFWKVNNKLYTLNASSFILVPENISFIQYYNNIQEKKNYIKYVVKDKCGIICVSESKIEILISHEESYVEISYGVNLFFAQLELKRDEIEYVIIDEIGRVISTFRKGSKKIEGYNLFYNDFNNCNDCSVGAIRGGIASIELKKLPSVTLIEIEDKSGHYHYYSDRMKFLFGDFEGKAVIRKWLLWVENRLLVCDPKKNTEGYFTKIFYLENREGCYKVEQIPNQKYEEGMYYYFCFDIDNDMELITFKNGLPIYYNSISAAECYDKPRYFDQCALEYFGDGYHAYILKRKDNSRFFILSCKGRVINYSLEGINLYKRIFSGRRFYVLEHEDGKLSLLTPSGNFISYGCLDRFTLKKYIVSNHVEDLYVFARKFI